MSRIPQLDPIAATDSQSEALRQLREAWGRVPNLGDVFALSEPLTAGMLAFDQALQRGAFAGAVAEQIAIAVANENACLYCLAAHTAASRACGVSSEDAAAARDGRASDPKVAAALRFAQTVARERGFVTDTDLAAVRSAGYSDAEVVELIGHVVANILSNYLHHVAEVPVDYPSIALSDRKAALAA